MTPTSDKSGGLSTQILEHFASHPVISVSPSEDDPANQYEITYTLAGLCKDSDGQIVETASHIIELSIPFGFPHFPPSCKPKSDIFHPDFDPAAICLGEFWQQGSSIPSLIIYIGKMINGEMYSTSNAFNEDAAAWYGDHGSHFPLAKIAWGSDGDSKKEEKHDLKIDTLDDADLSSGFDYLSLEEHDPDEEISLNTSFSEPEPSNDIDFQLLALLDKKKKYNQLFETAEKIEQPTTKSTDYFEKAKLELDKATKLHAVAKKVEDQGNPQEALKAYQQVKRIVSDFYGLSADITRIEQTLSLLDGFSPETDISAQKTTIDKTTRPGAKKDPPPTRKKTHVKKTLPDDSFLNDIEKKSRVPLYILAVILLSGITAVGYFYFSFNRSLTTARETYQQCTSSLKENAFSAAKSSCEAALLATEKVKFISKQHVDQLKKEITTTLHSEILTQGLAGNVLFDGRYYTKNEAEVLLNIKELFKQAEDLYSQGEWHRAFKLYGEILPWVKKNTSLEKSLLDTITARLKQAQFRVEYYKAVDFFNTSQWRDASKHFKTSKEYLKILAQDDQLEFDAQLNNYLLTSTFKKFKDDGDQHFSKSEWQGAVSSYKHALTSLEGTQFSSAETTLQILENVKKAELYSTISRGNKTFAAGAWNQAIDAYTQASSFLEKNQDLLSQSDAAISRKKLFRIILQASIIRERQNVRKKLETNHYGEAIESYQMILSMIKLSAFTSEIEFSDTNEEIRSAIQTLKHKILIREKTQYLKDNYQPLFSASYPGAAPDTLKNALVYLVEEKSGKLIFKLQCTETGGGRPLTLVMYYAFDLQNNTWAFYSPTQ